MKSDRFNNLLLLLFVISFLSTSGLIMFSFMSRKELRRAQLTEDQLFEFRARLGDFEEELKVSSGLRANERLDFIEEVFASRLEHLECQEDVRLGNIDFGHCSDYIVEWSIEWIVGGSKK